MDLASLSIAWTPLVAPWAILAFAAVGAGLVALGAWRRARGIPWRAAAVAVMAAALANPSLVAEEREALADVAVLLIDESASQDISPRPRQTAAAAAEMEKRMRALPNIELRVVRAGRALPGGEEGTRLFAALGQALADVPNRRLAGIVAITDGQVHDVPADPAAAGFDAPLHVLLTGLPEDGDRRLTLPKAPTFGLVGKPVTVTLRVDDLPEAAVGTANVALWKDGEPLPAVEVPLGVDHGIELPIDHGGPQVFEIAVGNGPRELSLVNNRAIAVVNGVRDRLRVLLISGEPYPGERTWRSLLKADSSVDLVHFTILRPPEKQDGTPVNELSLIAFPTRELFEAKLDEFDLVIFDRYRRGGVLPRAYFENIVDYVRAGGALLELSGADYAGPLSLYQSPLSEVLPAEPTGQVIERGFRPAISVLGRRHPVTADLPGAMSETGAEPAAVPRWGRWFRHVDTRLKRGTAVMEGVDGLPLLVLDRIGEGRVAQLLSDQIWLWSRGFEGGGPQLELLRRVAHWLMKEPELEEEALRATVADGRLRITRRSLDEDPGAVTVTTPSGRSLALEIKPTGPGRASADMEAGEIGLYRVSDGDRHAFAASGPLNPLEFADLRATAERLRTLADATGGAIMPLALERHPRIRKVAAGRDTAGSDWLGLRGNDDYIVRGVSETPLVPPILVLAAGLGVLLLAWWREGR